MKKNMTNSKGFTLIELLIVVAIIAILAAIAVPNFLEAQTRSKISRARADMRTVATALEAYAVDHNKYVYTTQGISCPGNPSFDPFENDCDGYGNLRQSDTLTIPFQLTTPIAFISSLPADVFKIGKDINFPGHPSEGLPYASGNPRDLTFLYFSTEQATTASFGFFTSAAEIDNARQNLGGWQLRSLGPQSLYANPNDPNSEFLSINSIYDSSNGTISFGHIIRNQKDPEGQQRSITAGE